MPSPIARLTIDTCVINATGQLEAMNQIERWHQAGHVEILGTYRLSLETSAHAARSAKASSYADIGEPFIVGVTPIGVGRVSDLPSDIVNSVAAVMFPGKRPENLKRNDINDVAMLASHLHANADIFVTINTKDFVQNGRREGLRALGVAVMTPDEAVAYLRPRIEGT